MNEIELNDFVGRYVSMWHERDALVRGEIVGSLFAADAENYTQRSASRGLDEIRARVTRAHDEWVAAKDCVFEPAGNTATHHHLVKFFWRMRPAKGGSAISIGLDVFVLNDDGKIRALYQFIEPDPEKSAR
jgi:hypothetical protein